MDLTIDGQRHPLTPMEQFRKQWGLPDSFTIGYFEVKEWEGLGSMEGAGEALATVRQRVVNAVPSRIAFPDLMHQVEQITALFSAELRIANEQVRLRDVEVEYAVAGFHNILQSVATCLIQRRFASPPTSGATFDFTTIYQAWLDDSVRLSGTRHRYVHNGRGFEVRSIYCAYGRIGLEVAVDGERYYLLDTTLSCPAASYMKSLCAAVAQRLCIAYLA